MLLLRGGAELLARVFDSVLHSAGVPSVAHIYVCDCTTFDCMQYDGVGGPPGAHMSDCVTTLIHMTGRQS